MRRLMFILLLVSLVLALGGQTYSLELVAQAKSGDLEAMNDLGLCYFHGYGIAKSYSEALAWWRPAADVGFAAAQHNVALCFANGYGYIQDKGEAVKWYRKAAEQEIAVSQNNLGVCYANGTGVETNLEKAAEWYRRAAYNDDRDGQFNYAVSCYHGSGTKQDYVMAQIMFEKAAEQGHATAANYLGICHQEGVVYQNLNKAYLWYLIADALGDENAAANLESISDWLTDAEIKTAKESSFYWLVDKGLQ